VMIASKTQEYVADAPGTVTVITAQTIRAMGARTITNVLATIPGIEICIKEYGFLEVVIRGGRQEGQRVKFLINGHAMNPPRTGQASIFLDDLTVENIQRIEIIRGPNSALYGTNALNGVINIITKDVEQANGLTVITKGGTQASWTGGVLFGHTLRDFKLAGYAEYTTTDGSEAILHRDAQTTLDELYAPYGIPAVSLAPGHVRAGRQKLDLNLTLNYANFTLQTKYLHKVNGPYIGANYTLNRGSEWQLDYGFIEGQYQAEWHPKLDVSLNFAWDRVTEDYFMEAGPDGFTIPFDLDGDGDIEIFPDGAWGHLATSFDVWSGELQGTYRPWQSHTLVSGATLQHIQQFDNATTTNFARGTLATLPPGQFDTSPSFADNQRTVWAAFLQDQWKMRENLNLTLGIRHDHYSDFGGTTNPRAAIVWKVIPALALKFLYGRAFLAPSFHETYLMNNPVMIGSRDLKPLTIQTMEVGAMYTITEHLTGSLAYFHNMTDDVIIQEAQPDPKQPAIYVNADGDLVQGIELELRTSWANGGQANLNYSWRATEVRHTQVAVPFVARHLAQGGLTLPVLKYLWAHLQGTFVGERPREQDDPRPPVKPYTIFTATLTTQQIYPGLECFLTVENIFDTRYTTPSIANTLPDDYPLSGRALLVGLRYAFYLR
jgi:outer membrane receptor for ferrienterochelin and colicin